MGIGRADGEIQSMVERLTTRVVLETLRAGPLGVDGRVVERICKVQRSAGGVQAQLGQEEM